MKTANTTAVQLHNVNIYHCLAPDSQTWPMVLGNPWFRQRSTFRFLACVQVNILFTLDWQN